MNCDEAFDHLTDPVRRHSHELRRHIQACRRCRQMQQTLEPALALFDQTGQADPNTRMADGDVSPAADSDAATTRHLLSSESVRLAEDSAARLKPRRWLKRFAGRSVLPYAATFLIGVFVAMGVMALPFADGDRDSSATVKWNSKECLWQHRDRAAPTSASSARSVVLVCVDCHLKLAEESHSVASTIQKVSQPVVSNCVSCHLTADQRRLTSNSEATRRFERAQFCLWPRRNG